MPQARSGGSKRSSSSSGSRSTRASSAKSSRSASSGTRKAASSTRAKAASSTRAKAGGTRSRTTRAKAGSADARVEAVAKRLRTLNERIIEAGKDAGETTLASYEKALKSIANTIQRGPGSSEVEWVSNLATAQAKFIRDVTASWTAAARKALK